MKNLLLWLFVLFLLFIFCDYYVEEKKKKDDLAKLYKVSKPTLLKWVQYLPCSMSVDEWKAKRFLSSNEYWQMQEDWGTDKVLSKKEIAEKAESNYKTVGENVLMNLDKIGITKEAWESLNFFPSKISHRILAILG